MVIKKVETIKEAEAAIEFANEQFETDFKKIEPKIYLHDTIGKTFTAFCGESMAGMFSISEFAYKNLNYQWDLNKPTYRGTSKSWFKDGWDILKDARPTDGNFFDFDFKNMKLVRA